VSSTAAVFRVECRKLLAQPRLRAGFAVLLIAPWLFIALVLHQDRLPVETLYGRYLKDSGFATPLVVLVFSTQWIFPLIASLISGDVFSSEDAHGTWKTVLTRSVSRGQMFWGKVGAAFTATVAAVVVLGTSATLAGVALVGSQPLVNVGGVLVPARSALGHVALSWLVVLPPVLAFAALAIAVSILTRSSVLGVLVPVVIGLVMQMYVFLNAWDTVRHVLLNSPMNAWRGLFDTPAYTDPLARGLLVALAYLAASIAVSLVVFHRRDVTGG
jgi:ABC-2 type transport system permease protein